MCAATARWPLLLLLLLLTTSASARLLHLNDDTVPLAQPPGYENSNLNPDENSHIPALAAYIATIGSGFNTNQLYVYFEHGLHTDIVDRIVRHPRHRIPPVTLHK